MDYKKVFYNKSDQEIMDLLDSYRESSNYDSKVALLQLVEERSILETDNALIKSVKQSLDEEETKIKAFVYLRNLGFKVKRFDDSFTVVRSRTARFVDLFGAILGLLFAFSFVSAFQNWRLIFEEGMEFKFLAGAIVYSIFGLFGMALLYKCLTRFFDYLGFEISKSATGVIISKTTDFKRQTITVPRENIFVEDNPKGASLTCRIGDSDLVLISTNGGPRFERTLRYLKFELTK